MAVLRLALRFALYDPVCFFFASIFFFVSLYFSVAFLFASIFASLFFFVSLYFSVAFIFASLFFFVSLYFSVVFLFASLFFCVSLCFSVVFLFASLFFCVSLYFSVVFLFASLSFCICLYRSVFFRFRYLALSWTRTASLSLSLVVFFDVSPCSCGSKSIMALVSTLGTRCAKERLLSGIAWEETVCKSGCDFELCMPPDKPGSGKRKVASVRSMTSCASASTERSRT